MKICPHCQNTYTDDSLQYCLQDGTHLNDYKPSEDTTAVWNNGETESETLVKPRQPAANYETQKSVPQQNWQPSQETVFATEPPEPEKSNTLKIVLLTLLGMVVLLAIGGVAGFVVWKNSRRDVVTNANTKPVNAKTPVANKSINSNQDDTANTNANTNVNVNVNANSNANINANVPTPTPKPTLNPEQSAQIKDDIGIVIDDWKDAYESLDLEYAMGYYAESVDYYNAGKVGIGRVRSDKQRAFDAYDTINFNISNLTVTPDASGEKATAVFDKEWQFENSEKTNSGKVRQQMQLVKSGSKWKITSEKDLKVYYVNK